MTEDKLIDAAIKAVYKSICKSLCDDWKGPIKLAVDAIINKHQPKIEKIVEDGYLSLIESDGFKDAVSRALQDKLARVLVARMGGELESQVNALKANPETRARITLAISECVKSI